MLANAYGPDQGGFSMAYAIKNRQDMLSASPVARGQSADLMSEVTRLQGIYESAVRGRSELRDALRQSRAQPAQTEPLECKAAKLASGTAQ